ncbi:putative endonuclease [Parvibaculum indicum]|uniref:GIY-YIG nuclease family protein n=1 Tax=Parvibaculum indicum TaxID=562969 RepID=UPI001421D324|nr:putative endonuclease [Parvibaculum indicum]
MNAFVYILRCDDGSYYVGSARGSLERRILEHNSGAYRSYTFNRRPVTLAFSESFERITDAVAAERKLKGWSRAKKEALIAGDFGQLKDLSKSRRTPRPRPSRRPCGPPQDEA